MRCACTLAGMVILGGAITLAQAAGRKDVITPAGYAYKPNFHEYYPRESERGGEEGLVKVRICYDFKGRVHDANIDASSGFERLDEAAMRAGRDIIVKPGTINGLPQADCVVVPMRFSKKRQDSAGTSASGKNGSDAAGQQDDTPTAELTYMPDIRGLYPRESKKNGEQGTVVVLVCYDAKGKALSSELYSSSGFALLDEAGVRAGRRIRLKPAQVDGKPREGCGAIPLKFSLER